MRTHLTEFVTLAIAMAIAATLALPAEAQVGLRGLARLGLEHGGEQVVQFMYSDGSTPEVTAGGGLHLTAGAVVDAFRFRTHAVEAQAGVGLKYRTIPPATNQDANWLRFPVEGLLFYRTPMGLRVGGGATVHLRNVLAASGATLNDRIEFRNTPGWLLQAEYLLGDVALDLRYTAMEYEIERGGSGTLDASSIGVGVNFFFGPPGQVAAVSSSPTR